MIDTSYNNLNDEFFIEIKKHKSFNELSQIRQEEVERLFTNVVSVFSV